MTLRAPSPDGAAVACPPAEGIAALVAGTLDEQARLRIDEHVSRCIECREVIVSLAVSEPGPASEAATRPDDEVREPSHRPLAELLATARLGEVVEQKWRLRRLLGTGGMGQVFEAEHVVEGTRGALKLLRPELADHPEAARRFLRERYAANRIEHPAFVRVIDDGTTAGGAPYLVMDLVEGPTLRRVVKDEGPLAESRVRALGAQILDAVAAAHAAGVLHRDLKPDNVALEPGGAVRILDFGIARLRDPRDADGSTITGQMLGTPTYMPPEQARGLNAEVDERVDVFATAATLVFLLTGNAIRPTTGALFEAMTRPVPPVRTLAPGVSTALASVLDRALAFHKNDRYASAAAMRAALLDERVEPGAAAVAEAAPRRAGRGRWAALAGVIGVGAIGLVGVVGARVAARARPVPPAGVTSGATEPATAEVPVASGPSVSVSVSSVSAPVPSSSAQGTSGVRVPVAPSARPPARPVPARAAAAGGEPRQGTSGSRPATAGQPGRPAASPSGPAGTEDPLQRRD